MSDERDGAGSAGDGSDTTSENTDVDNAGQTAPVSGPQRPTGKRTRRVGTATSVATIDADTVTTGDAKKPKAVKKDGPSRNPFTFVFNYLKQVVAELRKVIWPNRKQMVSYTTVVLVFLAFMVALIFGVDTGFAKLVGLVFG